MKHIFPLVVCFALTLAACKQQAPAEQAPTPTETGVPSNTDTTLHTAPPDTSKMPNNTKISSGVGMKVPTKPLSEGAAKPAISHEIGGTSQQEIQDLRKKLQERNKHLSPTERLMNLQQIKSGSTMPTTNLKDLRDKTK